MQELKIIAFTHKSLGIERIGEFHLEDSSMKADLERTAAKLALKELMFLSTCNRVECICVTDEALTPAFVFRYLQTLYPTFTEEQCYAAAESALLFEGEDAVQHLFHVASSMDSLVVGEREIITQVRNAFETCQAHGLTGDLIRLVVKHTIETAKQVYTETHIAHKPVSVVSLAHHKLRDLNVPKEARVLVVGAGQTNRNFTRLLRKRGFTNFTVFNRTEANAHTLANELDGTGMPLTELASYSAGFDVLVTCTGSKDPVITTSIYAQLTASVGGSKVVVDLAVPTDVAREVHESHTMHYIGVEGLKTTAEQNLSERKQELVRCEAIIQTRVEEFKGAYSHRQVELAMRAIPKQVKAIQEKAVNEVFANELETLDDNSREVVDKMMAYMEKKYNAVTMKMAKDILLSPAPGR